MIESAADESYLVSVEDGLLTLTFNRPEFGNAIPSTSVPGLAALFTAAQADPAIRCILIRGTGRMFSAGGDVVGFQRALEQSVEERQADFRGRIERLGGLVEAVVAFDRPIVAAVNGPAAGAGLLYPLAADIVLGAPEACFVFAHQKVGLSPDGGVSWLLPRVVGPRIARTLMLTAARVDADEALAIGLLTRIVETDALADEALKTARKLAAAPQTAIRAAKRMMTVSLDTPIRDQLAMETDGIVDCVGDADFGEGVAAFLEKRPAKFGQG